MDIQEDDPKINKLNDPMLKNVAILLIKLGLELVASQDETKITIEKKDFGHLDLLMKHKQLKRVFFIEVSTKKDKRAEKINHFFMRWSQKEQIHTIQQKFDLSLKYKIVRVYFDLSDKDELPITANYFDSSQGNYVLDNYDFRYFEDSVSKVGTWAKNDFFSYLDIKPSESPTVTKTAIQYYLGEKRAYAYVDTVANLLEYCYVTRRKRDQNGRAKVDTGYQRMLKMNRIDDIAKKIHNPNFLAFPNAILLSCPEKKQLCDKPREPNDCPNIVDISIPIQFCSCRIIDGQHRLLGFTKVEESYHETHAIPIVILEDITEEDEITTFIEINSEHKKIDRNLLLALEADRDWDREKNHKQFFEKQAVQIAKNLNTENGSPLKGLIFIPEALAESKGKIQLLTLVSAICGNNFIGNGIRLYQSDQNDITEPYQKILRIFSLAEQHLLSYCRKSPFSLFSPQGVRFLLRLTQVFERNKLKKNISMSFEQFFIDLSLIFDSELSNRLKDFYGEGGANRSVEEIIEKLKLKIKDNYKKMTADLRKI